MVEGANVGSCVGAIVGASKKYDDFKVFGSRC